VSGRANVVVVAIAGAIALGALAISMGARDRARPSARATPASAPIVAARAAEQPAPAHVRWIAVGGGSSPELSQVSLEDDLLLALEVLGHDGALVLFAGGPGTRAVQVRREEAIESEPSLRAALGGLLASRGGRDASYQPTRLPLHGPATLDTTLEALSSALADGDEPLMLWIAAHGDRGDVPAESTALLWAGGALDPIGLWETIAASESERPLRVVITSCYSGGFAEIAFDRADPAHGPSTSRACGLFATSWDEEASGCDPSPDRAAHDSYSIHLLEALRGRARDGTDVRAAIDLDHDDRITLREAHAYARIAALSFDLPTTTSDRLLRALVPVDEAERSERASDILLADEQSVIDAIGTRLRITDRHDAQARLDAIAQRRVELEAAIEELREEADALWWSITGELLSRWPVIDDPWHPEFDATIEREGPAIRAFLEERGELAAWEEAEAELGAMDHTLASMRIEAAPLRRWLDASDTIALASTLRAVGGDGWAAYQRLRECEDTVP
jgi:hypothetical protein